MKSTDKKRKAKPRKKREDQFRSDVEADFAQFLSNLEVLWWYEPCTFILPGKIKYTPDFMTIQDDEVIFYETKGSWKARGAASTKKSLKMAADTYWMFRWIGVVPGGKDSGKYCNWKLEDILP